MLDGALELLERLLDVDLLLAQIGEALLGVVVLGLGVEVDRAHAIDELRQLVDAPALLGVRRRARVVVADHAMQIEAAEALAHVLQQVRALELDALQRHLVLAHALVEQLELVAQLLELGFARAERVPDLLERARGLVELGVRFAAP